jgi:hypothetical protein
MALQAMIDASLSTSSFQENYFSTRHLRKRSYSVSMQATPNLMMKFDTEDLAKRTEFFRYVISLASDEPLLDP